MKRTSTIKHFPIVKQFSVMNFFFHFLLHLMYPLSNIYNIRAIHSFINSLHSWSHKFLAPGISPLFCSLSLYFLTVNWSHDEMRLFFHKCDIIRRQYINRKLACSNAVVYRIRIFWPSKYNISKLSACHNSWWD